MYAKKSLISLHIFLVVVRSAGGGQFVLGRRVVVWFVLGQIPARFMIFFDLTITFYEDIIATESISTVFFT